MKHILPIIAALTVAGTLSAQTVLSEDFSSGVPPTGWTHMNNNSGIGVGWILDAVNVRAWHEDESGVGDTDFTLISPLMDMSGLTTAFLHFDGETNWAQWLANHPSSVGNGVSTMEITTDGGVTWTEVWTDTSLNDFDTYSPDVDISAWAGMTGVQLGIHFFGNFAQEWWVDNVVIDDGGGAGGLVLAIAGACPGPVTLTVSGATPSGLVAIAHGSAGSFTIPVGSCIGTVIDISSPTLAGRFSADANGDLSLSSTLPAGACGRTVQAVDLSSCAVSNTVVL